MNPTLTPEQLLNVFQQRSTAKAYDPTRKIADADFAALLETARLSPSSFGFEPWRFVVVQNPDVRALINEHAWGAKGKILDCSHFVLILVRQQNTLNADADYIDHMMRTVHKLPEDIIAPRRETYRAFSQNDFNIDHDRARYDWACKQSYIALGNMLTAAALLGIDATAVEGFPLETLHRLLTERGVYDGDTFKLSVMAAFGYRADAPRPKSRQSSNDVIAWCE